MSIKSLTLKKALPWILIIGGLIGVFCAFTLSQDKIQALQNPQFTPACDLNPVISCGSVMKSAQATAFSVPNPFIGLIAYAALVTVGAAILAGGRFKRWFWLTLNIGMTLGTAFALWLMYESVFRIKALCPYCLGVDAVTFPMFWYVLLYSLDQKYIRLPKGRARTVYAWVRRHHLDLLLLWLLILTAVILKHFWYYYGRYF